MPNLSKIPEVGDIWRCTTSQGNVFHALILKIDFRNGWKGYLSLNLEENRQMNLGFHSDDWIYAWVA